MLAKKKKVNAIHVIQAKIKREDVNVVIKDFDIETWYKILGHVDEKGSKTLARRRFLPNFIDISVKTFVYCLTWKTHRLALKNFSLFRKSSILDLIHIDVCMMQNRSIKGVLYFITFIDNCSRKCKLLLWNLKTKCLIFLSSSMLMLGEGQEEN